MSAYIASALAFAAGYLVRWHRDRRISRQIKVAVQELRATLEGEAAPPTSRPPGGEA